MQQITFPMMSWLSKFVEKPKKEITKKKKEEPKVKQIEKSAEATGQHIDVLA